MRDVETIAKELSEARGIFNALVAISPSSAEMAQVRWDVACRKAALRFRALADELRAAIEAEEPPK